MEQKGQKDHEAKSAIVKQNCVQDKCNQSYEKVKIWRFSMYIF